MCIDWLIWLLSTRAATVSFLVQHIKSSYECNGVVFNPTAATGVHRALGNSRLRVWSPGHFSGRLPANHTSQLALAIINISPWILAIVYDLVLYILRRVWHEIPIWGGRAHGDARPRAPSLHDRSRRLSFAELIRGASPSRSDSDNGDELRRRHKAHVRNASTASASIEEEPDVVAS
jgi:hypothetical protein